MEFPETVSLSQGEGVSPGPGRQEIEEARAQLSSTALSPQEDALLSSVLKQLTAATKAVQVILHYFLAQNGPVLYILSWRGMTFSCIFHHE